MKNRKIIWLGVVALVVTTVVILPKFIVNTPAYDNHIELISKDSLDRLSNQILEQLFNDRVNNKSQRDSLLNNSQLSKAQIDEIQKKIRNRKILIKDTLIWNTIYKDTIIKRVIFKEIIRLDTVRDTIRIVDTIRTEVKERKKKRKRRKE